MKKLILINVLLILASFSFGQILIGKSDDGYGLYASGSGTLIEPDHDTMIELKGLFENYGVLGDDGVFTLYFDNPSSEKLETVETAPFTDVQCTYCSDEDQGRLVIRDSIGTKWLMDKDGKWDGPVKPSGMYAACNSSYRYALFQNQERITDYAYYYIYRPMDRSYEYLLPFLMAQCDSGYMVLDTLGKTLYPFAVKSTWEFDKVKNTFLCYANSKWGFFSMDGKYYFPLTEILEPYEVFAIDDLAYGSPNAQFIAKKNGKWGYTSADKLIVPYENDKLYHAIYGKSLVRLKDGKWEQIKVKGSKVIRELKIDDWYGIAWYDNKEFGVVKKDGRIIHIDLKSGKERTDTKTFVYKFNDRLEAHETPEGKYVGFNHDGKIIAPYPNDYLDVIEGNGLFYFIVSKDGMAGIINSDGKTTLPLEYENVQGISVFGDVFDYVSVTKDNKSALFAYDSENQEWKAITDFKFVDIRSGHNEVVAIGTDQNEVEFDIFEDGTMKRKR